MNLNDPPQIDKIVVEPSIVRQNSYSTIICHAFDPDGDSLEYIWNAPVGNIIGNGKKVLWQAPHPFDDYPISSSYPIHCKVLDPFGLKDAKEAQIGMFSYYLSFEDFRKGEDVYFRVPERKSVVIRTNSEWLDFFDKYWWIHDDTLAPTIDFETQMVIGVFWGRGYSGTGSYVQAIKSICILNDTIFVKTKLPFLGSGFMELEPYDLVKLEKLDLSVNFLGFN